MGAAAVPRLRAGRSLVGHHTPAKHAPLILPAAWLPWFSKEAGARTGSAVEAVRIFKEAQRMQQVG